MAKKFWTRISEIVRKQGGDTRFMQPRFDRMFLNHHHYADELVVHEDGTPLAAVYFTPHGKHPGSIRALMAAIRDRVK